MLPFSVLGAPSPYQGTGAMVPIPLPFSPYQINGTVLETPQTCTAPLTTTGPLVFAQSQFLLCWMNPSPALQTLLTTTSTASLTFALIGGEMVTGPVTLKLLSGPVYAQAPRVFGGTVTYINGTVALWQLLCTTMAPISVERWVMSSQFP